MRMQMVRFWDRKLRQALKATFVEQPAYYKGVLVVHPVIEKLDDRLAGLWQEGEPHVIVLQDTIESVLTDYISNNHELWGLIYNIGLYEYEVNSEGVFSGCADLNDAGWRSLYMFCLDYLVFMNGKISENLLTS